MLAAALRPGDTIALVAPASPYDPGEYERGCARLRALGFTVRPGLDHRPLGNLVAGTVQQRLAELHGAFSDPSVDAVMAIRGGYGVMHLLPDVDWDLIARHPKLLVGLSDLTPLLNAIWDRCGLVTLHGPMVVGLGGRTDDDSVARLFQAFTNPAKLPDLQADGDVDSWCISPGVANGVVCGGNLSMLAATAGTPYQLVTDGRILLLEDLAEAPYRLDRLLTQLRLAGMFESCAGLAFGELLGCDPPRGAVYALDEVIRDSLADLPIPIVWGLPFGHGSRNMTFPVGVQGELDAQAGRLRFKEPATTR